MGRKAKRKSNSKTAADNVFKKSKAVEKKGKQAFESSIPEDTPLLYSASTGAGLENFVSKSTVPKYVSKCDISEYDQKQTVSRSIPKIILPENVLKVAKYKSSLKDPVSKYESLKSSKDTADKDAFMETIYPPIPKVKIARIIPKKGSKSKSNVEKFEVKTILPESTYIRKKETISLHNIQAHIPNPEPELNVANDMDLSNSKDFFAVPKLPLSVEALKCCTVKDASSKIKIKKDTTKRKQNCKKKSPKLPKKSLPKKLQPGKHTKSTPSTKPLGREINKKSKYPQRAAAIAAEVKLTALQAPHKAKAAKKKKPGTRGRALVYKPMGFKTFKRIMTTVHRGAKSVIQQFLQLFCNCNFLCGGYNRYTYYKSLQYELEGLYGSLLKILRHLSKVLHHIEGRYKNQLKKLNLYVPQKRKGAWNDPCNKQCICYCIYINIYTQPFERKVNWTYPAKPSKRFKGELPILERKPHVRRTRPKPRVVEADVYEFWCYMERFTGNIVPLMKYKQKIRRDIRKTRCISNEENYEELKLMQSAVPENKYSVGHFKSICKETSCAESNLKKKSNEITRETASREKLCKLTSMLNSLKSLSDKNSLWLQTLFKWVEVEIERQHVKKRLNCNDEIVAQICDEILEILWHERDLNENQQVKVWDYIKTRRTYLKDLNAFCKDKHNLLPKGNEHHGCMSSMCVECSASKKRQQPRIIIL